MNLAGSTQLYCLKISYITTMLPFVIIALRRRLGSSNSLSPIHGLRDCRASALQSLQTFSLHRWKLDDFKENYLLVHPISIQFQSKPLTHFAIHIIALPHQVAIFQDPTAAEQTIWNLFSLQFRWPRSRIENFIHNNCRPPRKNRTMCLNGKIGAAFSAGRFDMIQKLQLRQTKQFWKILCMIQKTKVRQNKIIYDM